MKDSKEVKVSDKKKKTSGKKKIMIFKENIKND